MIPNNLLRYPQSWLDLPPTREDAKSLGVQMFFPPETCRACGCRARHYVSGGCVECKRRANSLRNRAALVSDESYARQLMADKAKPSRADLKTFLRKTDAKRKSRGRHNGQLVVSRCPRNQSAEDRAFLLALYAEAKRTGQSVDHSPVPFLRCHPLIAGLHVPGNVRLVDSTVTNSRQPLVPMSDVEAAAMVEQRLAVWRADVDETTGEVDWARYPWAL